MPTIEQLEEKLRKARELGDAKRRSRRAVVDDKILRRKLKRDIREARHPGIRIFGGAIRQATKDLVRVGKVGIKAGTLVTKDLIEKQNAKERKEKALQFAENQRALKKKDIKKSMKRKSKKKTVKKRPMKRKSKRTTKSINRNRYY